MGHMKKIAFLFILVVVATQVFGQRKKKQEEIDAMTIDSLTQATNELTLQLDSVSKEKELYFGVYTSIKDEVIKYDFDPSKITFLIDSLRTSKDSTSALLLDSSDQLKDSLQILRIDNQQLQVKLDSLTQIAPDKDDMVKELKQLKELLDNDIINQEDFDSKRDLILQKWQ